MYDALAVVDPEIPLPTASLDSKAKYTCGPWSLVKAGAQRRVLQPSIGQALGLKAQARNLQMAMAFQSKHSYLDGLSEFRQGDGSS